MKYVRTFTALCFLLSSWLMTGCETILMDDVPTGTPAPGEGKVVFSLPVKAVTRASAGKQTSTEQVVNSLLAVAFLPDGAQASATRGAGTTTDEASTPFYTAVPVDLTSMQVSSLAGSGNADFSFELGEEGTFRVCFLANARKDLADKLMAQEPGSFTLGDFKNKLVDQDPGGSDTDGALLMTSQYFDLTTSFTQPYNLGTVTLTRVMARIDLENAADGIEVTRILFVNRADKTRLFNDNHTGLDADCLQQGVQEYDLSTPLVGSVQQPATLATPMYSYEQLATSDANPDEVPYLDIRYVMPSVSSTREYSHKVYFVNKTDGQTLPLKRNTLYHVRMLNMGAKPVFSIEVKDWSEGALVTMDDAGLVEGIKKK